MKRNTSTSAEQPNAHFLPHDSGERIPISSYDDVQDDVRRGYILIKVDCQSYEHAFPIINKKGKNQHFTFV
jgi:hypothetical protein